MAIEPLADIPITPLVAALPKADIHLHQEAQARFERVIAAREGRPPIDRRSCARRVLAETPPGFGRLDAVYEPDAAISLDDAAETDPESFINRLLDVFDEAAADGAVLVEMRFGAGLDRPEFMSLFREAERRARARYPGFCAEAIGFIGVADDPVVLLKAERQLETCLRLVGEGLAGVDFRVDPYDTQADPALWEIAHLYAARASEAELGVTMHAGEFSTANLAAALRTPGLTRLGHAVYAASDPQLMEQLARSGITVECSLSCNVILGAVRSYEEHPIRRFVEHGIPVTLNTDLPVHACTTIGREYAIAAALGFDTGDLLGFTRNAVRASFTTDERRSALMERLQRWEAKLQT